MGMRIWVLLLAVLLLPALWAASDGVRRRIEAPPPPRPRRAPIQRGSAPPKRGRRATGRRAAPARLHQTGGPANRRPTPAVGRVRGSPYAPDTS